MNECVVGCGCLLCARVDATDLCERLRAGHAAQGTLDCELVCEARGLYSSSEHEHELDAEGWALCWRCTVVFSDDAAKCGGGERGTGREGCRFVCAARAECRPLPPAPP